MSRTTTSQIFGVLVAVYAVYVALRLPPLLVGGSASAPILLACFVAQVVCAVIAAIGLWRSTAWAIAATVALACAVVVTELVEGFALGLIAAGRAVLVSVVALLLAFAVAVLVRGSRRLGA